MGKKVTTDKGGLLVGATDRENGKGISIIAPEGKILAGGGEAIINEEATKLHCETLSDINQSTGGVALPCGIKDKANTGSGYADGGEIPGPRKAYYMTLEEYQKEVVPLIKEFKKFLKKNQYFVFVSYGGYSPWSYPELKTLMEKRQDVPSSIWFNFSQSKKEYYRSPEEQLETGWRKSQNETISKDAPQEIIDKKNEYIQKLTEIFDEAFVQRSLADNDVTKTNKRAIRYAIDNDVYKNDLEKGIVTPEFIESIAKTAGVNIPKKVYNANYIKNKENQEAFARLYASLPAVNKEVLKGLADQILEWLKPIEEEIFIKECNRYDKLILEIAATPEMKAVAVKNLDEFWDKVFIVGETETRYEEIMGSRRPYKDNVVYYKKITLAPNWRQAMEAHVRAYIEALRAQLIQTILDHFRKITKRIVSAEKISITRGAKGFQGEFRFRFEDGSAFDFRTQAIAAGGYNIQVFHYRYISDFLEMRLADGTQIANPSFSQIINNFSTPQLNKGGGVNIKNKEMENNSSELPQRIEAFLSQFPDNASSWRNATDEVRDLSRYARQAYNEQTLDVLEDDQKAIKSLDWSKFKTPAEWNTEGKKFIREVYSKMNEAARLSFLDQADEYFGLGQWTAGSGDEGGFFNALLMHQKNLKAGDGVYSSLAKIQKKYGDEMARDIEFKWHKYLDSKGNEIQAFERGGHIPNNYSGRTPWQVWSAWSPEQKGHFIDDHFEKGISAAEFSRLLPIKVEEHVRDGQYKGGGIIVSNDIPEGWALYNSGDVKYYTLTSADVDMAQYIRENPELEFKIIEHPNADNGRSPYNIIFKMPTEKAESGKFIPPKKYPVDIIDAWVEEYLNNNGLPKKKRSYQPEAGVSILNSLSRYGWEPKYIQNKAESGVLIPAASEFYYLKIDNIIRDKENHRWIIKDHGESGISTYKYSELAVDDKMSPILYSEIPKWMDEKFMSIDGCFYETERDKKLLEREIETIKTRRSISEMQDEISVCQERLRREEEARENDKIRHDEFVAALKKKYGATIEGMEAMAGGGVVPALLWDAEEGTGDIICQGASNSEGFANNYRIHKKERHYFVLKINNKNKAKGTLAECKAAAKDAENENVADVYEKGGKIKNQYEGKLAGDVWDEWDFQQRMHFFDDHYEEWTQPKISREEFRKIASDKYIDVPRRVQRSVEKHVFQGQYEGGGRLSTVSQAKAAATAIEAIEQKQSMTETEVFDALRDLGYEGTDKGKFLDLVITELVGLGVSVTRAPEEKAEKGTKINSAFKTKKDGNFWRVKCSVPKGLKNKPLPAWAKTLAKTVDDASRIQVAVDKEDNYFCREVIVSAKKRSKDEAESIASKICEAFADHN